MAELAVLKSRLTIRLPGRTSDEVEGWITESLAQHDTTVEKLPAKQVNAILAHAEYLALKGKAAETAENPSLNIKGVGINKSGASANYERLLKEAWRTYQREAAKAGMRAIGGGVVTGGTAIRVDGR